MSKNYTTKLNTFIFRRVWGMFFSYLPDEDAGKLIKAIFAHTQGESAGELLQDAPKLRQIAGPIIHELERNAKYYIQAHGLTEEEETDL